MQIRIHAYEPASRANGPGLRAVIWVQGCTIGCPGCFNPETHSTSGGALTVTEELARSILDSGETIEGISVSGGEPFQQPAALLDLLLRLSGSSLSVLVFSGYTLGAIRSLPMGPEILKHVDVLIGGPYAESAHFGRSLLGSSNQSIHFLTARYRPNDFRDVPAREVILHKDGAITLTGIAPFRAQSAHFITPARHISALPARLGACRVDKAT